MSFVSASVIRLQIHLKMACVVPWNLSIAQTVPYSGKKALEMNTICLLKYKYGYFKNCSLDGSMDLLWHHCEKCLFKS